jgi:UDP-2,3-diacylglucosamine hydrolase
MKDYFEQELGAIIYREATDFEFQFADKRIRVCMGHGDGMGPGDYGYKLLKKVFVNPIAQFLFGWMHPDLGVRLAHAWSGTRKTSTNAMRQISLEIGRFQPMFLAIDIIR